MESADTFKICAMCGYQWKSLEEFATDVQLRLEGYMADFAQPENGLIVLTHVCHSCHSTLSLATGNFEHWRTGPIVTDLRMMSNECPGHCLDSANLEVCTVDCSMRWVREVLQYLKAHKIPEHLLAKERVKMDL